jgi:hypothetical protein
LGATNQACEKQKNKQRPAHVLSNFHCSYYMQVSYNCSEAAAVEVTADCGRIRGLSGLTGENSLFTTSCAYNNCDPYLLQRLRMRYLVKIEQISLAKRITRTSIVFALTVLVAFLMNRLWHAQSDWAFWLFDALVAAGVFFTFESLRREYQIEVTDETISMRGALGSHKIRRGHVQFLREWRGNVFREPALRLSEHGPIHRFLFGCVSVPTSMPQYEEIKTKAMSWMEVG